MTWVFNIFGAWKEVLLAAVSSYLPLQLLYDSNISMRYETLSLYLSDTYPREF